MKVFVPGCGARVIPVLKETPGVSEVITSQLSPDAYGNFLADRSYQLPRFDDPEFIDRFLRVYERERFDVCLPAHDAALVVFSRNRSRFEDLDFQLAMNSAEVIEVVGDKIAMTRYLAECGLPTLETVTLDDFVAKRPFEFPCYLKPRFIEMRDSPSGIYVELTNSEDLERSLAKITDDLSRYVVQPFVEGTEYNIDFFCDGDGEVRSVVALKRLSMNAGRAIANGEIVLEDGFTRHVEAATKKLRFWGPAQLQMYRTQAGGEVFTEINARLSGSSVFVRAAGVDYFRHLMALLEGKAVDVPETARLMRMGVTEIPYFYEESPMRSI